MLSIEYDLHLLMRSRALGTMTILVSKHFDIDLVGKSGSVKRHADIIV